MDNGEGDTSRTAPTVAPDSTAGAGEWRCFHCGMVLREERRAREHFGPTREDVPLCKVEGHPAYKELQRQLRIVELKLAHPVAFGVASPPLIAQWRKEAAEIQAHVMRHGDTMSATDVDQADAEVRAMYQCADELEAAVVTPRATEPQWFPIQGKRTGEHQPAIPWSVIAPCEAQALANHDQSLEKLASRGGLSPCEAVAVLEGRPWREMDWDESVKRLRELLTPRATEGVEPVIAEAQVLLKGISEEPWYIANAAKDKDCAGGLVDARIYDKQHWGVVKPTSGRAAQDAVNARFLVAAPRLVRQLLAALASCAAHDKDQK